ncbi:MAG: hypothetical protein QF664_10635 [Dehalococcoidia bacterium]|nr:hypothetical protein [Dehalococcoidia bacterium]
MGTKELEALIEVLQGELAQGRDGHVIGSWTIRYDKERTAFTFDKCEDGIYCEERPAVIGLDRTVIDAGGPLLA